MKRSALLFLLVSCFSIEGQAGDQIVQGLFNLFPSSIQTSVKSTVESVGGIVNYAADIVGGYTTLTAEEKNWMPILFECCARGDYSFCVSLFNLMDYLGHKAGKTPEEIGHIKRKFLVCQDKDGNTMLHKALMHHPQEDLVIYLLNQNRTLPGKHSYDPDILKIKNQNGLTPIEFVVQNHFNFEYLVWWLYTFRSAGSAWVDPKDGTKDLSESKTSIDTRSAAAVLDDFFVDNCLPWLDQSQHTDVIDKSASLFVQLIQTVQQQNTYDNHVKILQLIDNGALQEKDDKAADTVFELLALNGKIPTIQSLFCRDIFPKNADWMNVEINVAKYIANKAKEGFKNINGQDVNIQVLRKRRWYRAPYIKFDVDCEETPEIRNLLTSCDSNFRNFLQSYSNAKYIYNSDQKEQFLALEGRYIELRNSLMQRIQQVLPQEAPAEPIEPAADEESADEESAAEPAAEEVHVPPSSQNFANGIQFLQTQLPDGEEHAAQADDEPAEHPEEHHEPGVPSTLKNDGINLLRHVLHKFFPSQNRNNLLAVLFNQADQILLGFQDHADGEHPEVHIEAPAAGVPAAEAPATLLDWCYNTVCEHKIATAFGGTIIAFAAYDLAKWMIHKTIRIASGTVQFSKWFGRHVKNVALASANAAQWLVSLF